VLGVLSLLLVFTTATPHAQSASEQFILRAPAALIQDIAARHGLTIVRQIEGQDVFVVTKASQPVSFLRMPGDTTSQTQSQTGDVTSDPDVQSFEPNSTVSTPEVASPLTLNGSVVSILDGLGDTQLTNYFDNQVWVRYVDQPATSVIGLSASHSTAGTGAGIVAIIDTGVDPNHPALSGSLVPGYDFIHETAGIASEWSDVDGSVVSILDGSVVSILDGEAVTLNGSVVAILDHDTAAALEPALLPHAFGHGTMVAGLVHLVAPTAQIMPLKAFHADGTSTVFDVVRAIYYAVDHGARVINMSFSATSVSAEITHAINYATTHGVICVASAGNLGQETVVYPGGLRNVVGVASTSSTTPALRSAFSNYGDALVSVGAPGEAVITTYPGAHFAAAWGTSFSAPLVAGGAALLVRVDPSVDQGKAAELLGKAQPMTGGMGKGRLNLAEAVSNAADTTPPSVSVASPTSGGNLFGSVLLAASASDNVAVAGVKFLLDDQPLGAEITAAPFQQSWSTTSAANGSHVLTAVARDRSGNLTASNVNVTVSNDIAAPTVTLVAPSAGGSVAGTVNVTAIAADDIEVAGVRFTVDGMLLGAEDTAAPYESVWTTTGSANGSHVLTAIAHDGAGHETATSVIVAVTNDGGSPTVTLTSPANGTTLSGTVALAATANDDIGVVSVQFLVDGSPAGVETPAGRFWNTTTAANGAHVVSAVARDAAGHETTATAEVTVSNDLHAPVVALTTPVDGVTLGGLVSVLAAASDDIGVIGVQFKVDGALVGTEDTQAPYEALWDTASASNGSHVVSAIARDAAGHETNTSVTVAVTNDGAPPSVTLTNPAAGSTVGGTVSVVAAAADDIGVVSVQFLVDGNAAGAALTSAPYEWAWNTGAASNGPHTVTAVARDAAGHETTTTAVVTVSNDHAAPTVALTGPAGGATLSGTVSLAATAADDIGVVSVQFLVDGVAHGGVMAAAPYESAWNTTALPNGAHTVTAVARDAAGHETTASAVVTVLNDLAAPTVALVSPVVGLPLSGIVSIAAVATDDIGVSSVQFAVDGVAVASATAAPYEWSWNTANAANGLHTVTAVARDAAGHETTASVEVTVLNLGL
jgi:subtilisin family serine protease